MCNLLKAQVTNVSQLPVMGQEAVAVAEEDSDEDMEGELEALERIYVGQVASFVVDTDSGAKFFKLSCENRKKVGAIFASVVSRKTTQKLLGAKERGPQTG